MIKARTKTCSLVMLWLMFSIALGLPLLHPVLHSRLIHNHERSVKVAEIIWTTPDDEYTHECSICRFLANSQLCVDGLHPAISFTDPVGFTRPAHPLFVSEPGSFTGRPRAPPSSIST